jgi:hypothetical protein
MFLVLTAALAGCAAFLLPGVSAAHPGHAHASKSAAVCSSPSTFSALRTLLGDRHKDMVRNQYRLPTPRLATRSRTSIITVNVYFHVIRSGTGADQGNISDAQIQDQIDVLNDSYSGATGGADTGFRFNLAGVTRTTNSDWFNLDYWDIDGEEALKSELRQGGYGDLNIYSANLLDGILGWAYFPVEDPNDSDMTFDGVMALYSSLPGGDAEPYNEGDTITHEVGHWLGLYHTFENGCYAPGDEVDDTPFEAEPAFGCPGGSDTCPQTGDDPIHNFMDYSDDGCMDEFTAGQGARMQAIGISLRGFATGPAFPSITTFSPTSGPVGTSVTINGSDLSGASDVEFNGTDAASFTVGSSTKITAVVATGTTSGTISITTPDGTATSASSYTVTLPPPPKVKSFTPLKSFAGTNVTITGANFTGATAVQFNGTDALSFTVNSNTKITAVVAPGSTTGKISVTTPSGTGTSGDSFKVVPPPTPKIKKVNPSKGPVGATVAIKGVGFTGASAVRFNGTDAQSFTVVSSEKITAVVAAGTTSGPVSVTAPGGTATSPGRFTVT